LPELRNDLVAGNDIHQRAGIHRHDAPYDELVDLWHPIPNDHRNTQSGQFKGHGSRCSQSKIRSGEGRELSGFRFLERQSSRIENVCLCWPSLGHLSNIVGNRTSNGQDQFEVRVSFCQARSGITEMSSQARNFAATTPRRDQQNFCLGSDPKFSPQLKPGIARQSGHALNDRMTDKIARQSFLLKVRRFEWKECQNSIKIPSQLSRAPRLPSPNCWRDIMDQRRSRCCAFDTFGKQS